MGTGGLIAARIVQGVAVGAATGTTTAMIMDSGPNPRLSSILSSAVPSLGVAIGAVLAGALVEFALFLGNSSTESLPPSIWCWPGSSG